MLLFFASKTELLMPNAVMSQVCSTTVQMYRGRCQSANILVIEIVDLVALWESARRNLTRSSQSQARTKHKAPVDRSQDIELFSTLITTFCYFMYFIKYFKLINVTPSLQPIRFLFYFILFLFDVKPVLLFTLFLLTSVMINIIKFIAIEFWNCI